MINLEVGDYGWAHLYSTHYNKRFALSYIQDIPTMLLNAIQTLCSTNEPQEIEFDAEGYYWTLYLGDPIYIKDENDTLIDMNEDLGHFVSAVLLSLECDSRKWADFQCEDLSEEELDSHEKKLLSKIQETRRMFDTWKR